MPHILLQEIRGQRLDLRTKEEGLLIMLPSIAPTSPHFSVKIAFRQIPAIVGEIEPSLGLTVFAVGIR
jgi:hypothetical protein